MYRGMSWNWRLLALFGEKKRTERLILIKTSFTSIDFIKMQVRVMTLKEDGKKSGHVCMIECKYRISMKKMS